MEKLIRQFFLSLAVLHACRYIHRDLSACNFLVEQIDFEQNIVTVAQNDFDLLRENDNTSRTVNTGKPNYQAPEISSKIYDEKVDIYAAGSVLYEIMTQQTLVSPLHTVPSEIIWEALKVRQSTNTNKLANKQVR